ncbi:MAG: hypothetical protein JRH03_14085, partial [Deltaproteobacteria bacterium]|nr:hypothetical protein [Deltaproteobacteria bacterium]
MKSLGICLGASSVSIAQIETDGNDHNAGRSVWKYNPRLTGYAVHAHDGNPKKTLIKALDEFELAGFDRVAATGRKFRKFV